MNRKSLLALNLTWAALVVCAFLAGPAVNNEDSDRSKITNTGDRVSGLGRPALPSAKKSGDIRKAADRAGRDPEAGGRMLADALQDDERLRRKEREDRLRRQEQLAALVRNVNPENATSMAKILKEAPRDDDMDRLYKDFLRAWGEVAGADAMAYVLGDEAGHSWIHKKAVISGWAASDLNAAKDFVASVGNEDDLNQRLHGYIVLEVLRTDLDEAIAYSQQMEQNSGRRQTIEAIGYAVVRQRGLDGLESWVAGIDHTNEEGSELLSYKRWAVIFLFGRMAAKDPERTREWILAHGGQPYVSYGNLHGVAEKISGNPEEQLALLSSLPNPGMQLGYDHLIARAFFAYLHRDFDAAGKWLAAQPLGPNYDRAIQRYIIDLAFYDPEAALIWADQISDEGLRKETRKDLAQRIQDLAQRMAATRP